MERGEGRGERGEGRGERGEGRGERGEGRGERGEGVGGGFAASVGSSGGGMEVVEVAEEVEDEVAEG